MICPSRVRLIRSMIQACVVDFPLSALPVIGFQPDIVHCHDWQT